MKPKTLVPVPLGFHPFQPTQEVTASPFDERRSKYRAT